MNLWLALGLALSAWPCEPGLGHGLVGGLGPGIVGLALGLALWAWLCGPGIVGLALGQAWPCGFGLVGLAFGLWAWPWSLELAS